MIKKIKPAIVGSAISILLTTNAFAFGGVSGGGGGGGVVGNPEIDGPGALLAVALLASIGVMIYRKSQK